MNKFYHVIVSKQNFDDEDTYLESFYGCDKVECVQTAIEFLVQITIDNEKEIQKSNERVRETYRSEEFKDMQQRSEKRIEGYPEEGKALAAALLNETTGNLLASEKFFYWHRMRLFEFPLK